MPTNQPRNATVMNRPTLTRVTGTPTARADGGVAADGVDPVADLGPLQDVGGQRDERRATRSRCSTP